MKTTTPPNPGFAVFADGVLLHEGVGYSWEVDASRGSVILVIAGTVTASTVVTVHDMAARAAFNVVFAADSAGTGVRIPLTKLTSDPMLVHKLRTTATAILPPFAMKPPWGR